MTQPAAAPAREPIQWTRFFLGCGCGLLAGYLWAALCYAFAGYWLYIVAVFVGLGVPVRWSARRSGRTDFRIGLAMGLLSILLLVVIVFIVSGGPTLHREF